jgi:hypothetical protein
MATPWPQGADWSLGLREHATELTKYLRDTLDCIDRSQGQAVPASHVRTMTTGTLTMISKTLGTPDLTTIQDALSIMQTEAKERAKETAKAIETVTVELRNNAADIKRSISIGEQTRAAAVEATEKGRKVVEVVKELKDKAPSARAHGQMSYAAAAANGMLGSGTQSTNVVKAVSLQAQREIIVSTRNPLTISKPRAMNPRNLKSHIERALEQSQNEHIAHVKIMSSNQLKSGDLSLRTATTLETQALRQFAEDWVSRVGNGAYVRNPTYGILAHGIRTSTMEMDKFEEIRDNILQDNRPFIPRAEIKYVGWLTRNATSKSASSVIIDFTKPEDANKTTDEGLVWQGELFQCERYERQCRLKQCFKCQRYGHIGTQCKAITACGYCAQEHGSRDCPSKAHRVATRKCAACGGAHKAWSHNCPTRKDELAGTKAAYATRSRYHPVPEACRLTAQPGPMTGTLRRRRSVRDMIQSSETTTAGETSPPERGQKRSNTGLPLAMADKGNEPPRGMRHQRPQRTANPSRRALEALENNTMIRTNSQHMEIDSEVGS